MWAYALTAPRHFDKVEVPAPEAKDLKDDEVLIKVLAGVVCGSDLAAYMGHEVPMRQFQGTYAATYPGFPMHEVVGQVLSSRSPLYTAGQHVVGWAEDDNAVSETIITAGTRLATVDVDLDPTVVILIQTLACVIYAVDRIGDVEGHRCAVLGQGPIGTLFSHVLKSRGAEHITGVDLVDRSDFAADFGVDEVVCGSTDRWASQISDNRRPSIVVEAIGHQHTTLGDAIKGIAANGRIYYFGIPEVQPISFDLYAFLRKSLLLQAGTTQSRHEYLETAREHLKAYPFLTEKYITHVFDVDQVNDAYEMATHPSEGRMKVAVKMA